MELRPAPPGYRPYEIGFDLVEGFTPPFIAYRETLGRRAEIDYTHKKQTGGTGQFARVKLIFEPLPPGSGFVFENEIVGGSIPKEFIPGVEKGLKSVMNAGPLAGFPVIDFKVSLVDGAFHDVDSSVLAFEVASRAAFRKGIETAEMKLLEPVMKLAVSMPGEFVGTVTSDLRSRRGVVLSQRVEGDVVVVDAMAPCADLMTYGRDLRMSTSGKARCSGEFVGLRESSPHGLDPETAIMRLRA